MRSLISLPYTKAFVRTSHLRQISGRGTLPAVTHCYFVAVRVILNEAPRMIVLTEEGAMFDSVPPHAICFNEKAPELALPDACRWDCLGDAAELVTLDFVRNWNVEWQGGCDRGAYLFTLHFDPLDAWGRLPEQLKMFHFIEGNDGNLYIRVNNELRWLCDALDQPEKITVIPESNLKIWSSE